VPRYSFTVDAKLLQELGERLVGRPHIALAELIKNAYDADATLVELDFAPDRIVILDNGHGMSALDFETKWMRIGTPHKASENVSPAFRRQLTGSKGIGRLSAQLLASELVVTSVALRNKRNLKSEALEDEIHAPVDWASAVRSGDLTSVTVDVEDSKAHSRFAGGSRHGTRLDLLSLSSAWSPSDFRQLAQEVWSLQSPFESDETFKVVLNTDYSDVYDEFSRQMTAILNIWNGRVRGRLRQAGFAPPAGASVTTLPSVLPRVSEDVAAGDSRQREQRAPNGHPDRILEATIQVGDRPPRKVFWRIENCEISNLRFDIRVFDLTRRQPQGIRVDTARSYLRRFGGVGIYDGGFRLPYYGADLDWLNIESDNAARLTASSLLPKEWDVRRGLLALPRNSNLFGEVFVSTSSEAAGRANSDALAIQSTRDRLVDNAAYQQLRVLVRAPMDAYAMEKTIEQNEENARRVLEAPLLRPASHLEAARVTLYSSRDSIPSSAFESIDRSLLEAIADTVRVEERSQQYASLLGALATAGITSLAYEHEVSKQLLRIDSIAATLSQTAATVGGTVSTTLKSAVSELLSWSRRARDIRKMFAPLVSPEDRETVTKFKARTIVDEVWSQVKVLAHSTKLDAIGVPKHLFLPPANLPAWSAILQNLLVNSFNALSDVKQPQIKIDGGDEGGKAWLRVQDNGSGVDLGSAEEFWEPFKRGKGQTDPDHLLGGTGLGLTIVRMIAEDIQITIDFTPPTPGFSTAVTLTWKDKP